MQSFRARAVPRIEKSVSRAFVLCALATSAALPACSTSYYPQSPRVAVVRGEFRRGLVKNGQYYPGGLFGGNVVDAVRGVPAAEAQANTYAGLSVAGSWCIIGGEALGVTASVVSATAKPGDAKNDAQIGLIVASGVAFVTGIVLHFMSEGHLYDAANIYNDEMDRRGQPKKPDGPAAGVLSAASDTRSTSPSRPADR
jgi:hypothetical protein